MFIGKADPNALANCALDDAVFPAISMGKNRFRINEGYPIGAIQEKAEGRLKPSEICPSPHQAGGYPLTRVSPNWQAPGEFDINAPMEGFRAQGMV
jgi:hypothetical protein